MFWNAVRIVLRPICARNGPSPIDETVVVAESTRIHAMPKDELYRIISDIQRHHRQILPSGIQLQTWDVVTDPGTSESLVTAVFEERGVRAPVRYRITERDSGREIGVDEVDRGRWLTMRVDPVDACRSRLTLRSGVGVEEVARSRLRRLRLMMMHREVMLEMQQNIERYRGTLGARVV